MLRVIQSWDDGVVDDIRLADLCRKYEAKASFNLSPGLHEKSRGHGWAYGDKEVLRLARDELDSVYQGFEIANHTMTHPDLRYLSPDNLSREIAASRKMLQDWFNQPVDGFCYPYGNATPESQEVIEASGHRFARHADGLGGITTGASFALVKPHCYFTDENFRELYDAAKQDESYFFFWGHSYELVSEQMWDALERLMEQISGDPESTWETLGGFVTGQC